jgi:BLOC-1 related complex subunit 6
MSTSYSEISSAAAINQNYEKMDVGEDLLDDEREQLRNRPDSLYDPYDNDGQCKLSGEMCLQLFTIPFLVLVDDNNPGMKHFVANDLEYKIKISSPVGPAQPFGSLPKQFSSSLPPQLDSNVLNDLEIEAQYLAANIDNLTENLANLLHSISSITADNVEVYKNSVTKLTDTIDSNIKSMYSIIAKSEEISKSMHKAEQMATRIREIRRLVDMFEATL